jgi:hypothetical protein
VDPLTDATRRSIYLYVDRYQLPGVFNIFDFANPEMTTARRDTTIVPQQSLFLMNSQWLLDRAHDLAARDEVRLAKTPEAQVQALYAIVYQRRPDNAELTMALQFVRNLDANNTIDRLAHAMLQTNELLYIQ